MTSPILFLDFDDVVNTFASRNAYRSNKSALGYLKRTDVYVDGIFYPVNWSAELVMKMNAAKSDFGFTWLWLTTWKSNAVNYVDPKVGTRSDGFIDWDADGGMDSRTPSDVVSDTRDSRKYAALLAHLANNPAPFVWIDDSATLKYNKDDFVGDLDVPHLVITPDAKFGMLRHDLDAMVSFFASVSA